MANISVCICVYVWVSMCVYVCIYRTPPSRAGCDTELNSFPSLWSVAIQKLKSPVCLTILPIVGGRIVGHTIFPRVLALCEMQSDWFRIWTHFTVSIPLRQYHYSLSVSPICVYVFVCFCESMCVRVLFISDILLVTNVICNIGNVDWKVVLFYSVSTLFGSFNTELSHFDESFKRFSLT